MIPPPRHNASVRPMLTRPATALTAAQRAPAAYRIPAKRASVSRAMPTWDEVARATAATIGAVAILGSVP
ncbi:hypothetical protein CJ226_01250 [Microbacterium sp. UMB0228]|nr:hypothetical protein CJ226_01250 [Microbacterium sp. UMB0228]